MKKVQFLISAFLLTILFGCEEGKNYDDEFNSKVVSCGNDLEIEAVSVKYELYCDHRKLFVLQSLKENSNKAQRFIVDQCTVDENDDDIVYATLENGIKISVFDNFMIIGEDIYCNSAEDCAAACKQK